MSLFSFVKEAGEKLIDLLTPGNANAEEQLKKHVEAVGLGNPNITATVEGDKIILKGEVASQEEKEKIILAATAPWLATCRWRQHRLRKWPASAALPIRTACALFARSQPSRLPSSQCIPAIWTTGREI